VVSVYLTDICKDYANHTIIKGGIE
jgi:hypothetical protein